MATIDQIDVTKPLSFTGSVTSLSDNAVLVDLAKKHCNQRMRMVSQLIGDPVDLLPEEGKRLLEHIGIGRWRKYFDYNLQCISCDEDGHDLLSGWLTIDEFSEFINTEVTDDPFVSIVIGRLKIAVQKWKESHVDEVYFDGYKRVEQLETYSYK